jgi:hypothetical protein
MSKPVIEVLSEEKITLNRILGKIKGTNKSPTVIAFGGIHGNEFAGVKAIQNVFKKLEAQSINFSGNFYGITGNIPALEKKVRFVDQDLNRVWTTEHIVNAIKETKDIEEQEQLELYNTIKEILVSNEGPFFFLDIHTTSCPTEPFITISDSLNNREFSSNFKIPIVLGIEEFLDGPLLTYINEFGHVALGFEAGQHDDPISAENAEAFLWSALMASGCIQKSDVKDLKTLGGKFTCSKKQKCFFEIDFKYTIQKNEKFKIIGQFNNFEKIKKGQNIAVSNGKVVKANQSGRIFMRLYQKKGDDGFFIVTKISLFWLLISKLVRNFKMHLILQLLPGVRASKDFPYALVVNPRTAKYLATEIFHLFGYRKKIFREDKWYFIRRDREVSRFI